ncbi:unnamed protein product [Effrenium voratum]|nr:unnamed protein product [Effrenium voratum]
MRSRSVATALALRNCTQKSAVTVLLQGKFAGILEEFFRVSSADQAPRVAMELFRIMNQHGIRLQIVFDNTFDTGLMGEDPLLGQIPLLMDLTRHAFQYRHHLIVTTQSEEAAREAATLNGERTRAVQQEDARTYRWRNTQARDFLTNNPLMDFREQTVEVVLNMTQIPDTFGGWRPVSIMEYVQTGRRPQAPQEGQGAIAAIARAVWVRQLQQEENGEYKLVGNALPIKPVPENIGFLKEVIKEKEQMTPAASKLRIFHTTENKWQEEEKMSAALRPSTEETPYGYLVP